MKKLLALILALCMACTSLSALAEAAAATEAPETTEPAELPEGLEYNLYVQFRVDFDKEELVTSVQNGVFRKDDYTILFMSVREFYRILVEDYGLPEPTITVDSEGLTITRVNGSSAQLKRNGDELIYSDAGLFEATPNAVFAGDLSYVCPFMMDEDDNILVDDNGEPYVNLISRQGEFSSFYRTGDVVSAYLSEYDIPVYWADDDVYLPVSVLSTMFFTGITISLVYLEGGLYFLRQGAPDSNFQDDNGRTMADYYYEIEEGDRPESLVNLTYNLLCLDLDLHYGLKDEHGIGNDFDAFLDTVGLKSQMLEPDGKSFNNALSTLTRSYFSDFHSGVHSAGPYAGQGYSYLPTSVPASFYDVLKNDAVFKAARCRAGLSQLVPGTEDNPQYTFDRFYEEVGDTAYITFDSFDFNLFANWYSSDYMENAADNMGSDTIALIYYANSQINREDSPVRRVVIDLSLNSGGSIDAAIFVLSWLLGTCRISSSNPATGANYTVLYQADINLDGKITDEDHLDTDKLKIYCLTSFTSFSCGNLVPYMLKESNKVTLLGQTTGGGACCVKSTVTADGTQFNYSGFTRLCYVKNGSYYSVDQGVDPDFTISNVDHFYDREWLNSYLDQLP